MKWFNKKYLFPNCEEQTDNCKVCTGMRTKQTCINAALNQEHRQLC